jgi:hypothetical protein
MMLKTNQKKTTLKYEETLMYYLNEWYKKGKIRVVRVDGDMQEARVFWKRPPNFKMCMQYNLILLWNKIKCVSK